MSMSNLRRTALRTAMGAGLAMAAATTFVPTGASAAPPVGTGTGTAAVSSSGVRVPARSTIPLPNGFAPEDITRGQGGRFYVGSLADGAVYAGNLRTGRGRMLVAGRAGAMTTGLSVDARNRVWAVGGATGTVDVYDGDNGRRLGGFPLFTPDSDGFLSDLIIRDRAAYVSDSFTQRLFVLPLSNAGLPLPGRARSVPLTGDIRYTEGFNANGIVSVGPAVLIGQTNTGKLFNVDTRTGRTREVAISGGDLTGNDGMVVRGRTLFTALNVPNQVAVVRLVLDRHCGCVPVARLLSRFTSDRFDVPASVEVDGAHVYALNARFGTAVTPTTAYQIVRVPLPRRLGGPR